MWLHVTDPTSVEHYLNVKKCTLCVTKSSLTVPIYVDVLECYFPTSVGEHVQGGVVCSVSMARWAGEHLCEGGWGTSAHVGQSCVFERERVRICSSYWPLTRPNVLGQCFVTWETHMYNMWSCGGLWRLEWVQYIRICRVSVCLCGVCNSVWVTGLYSTCGTSQCVCVYVCSCTHTHAMPQVCSVV